MPLQADDVIDVLQCPSCNHVDVDFEKRSESLVRCGLCQRFVVVTETVQVAPQDDSGPGIVTLRGYAFSPTPPRKKQSRTATKILTAATLLILGSSNAVATSQGWWCTEATGPVDGYTFSVCYRTDDGCQKFRTFNSSVELLECRFQKKAVAFSFYDNLRDTTEQRVSRTTVSCEGNRAFLLKSEQRNDISHVTKCRVVE